MIRKIISILLVLMLLISSAGIAALAENDEIMIPEVGEVIEGFKVFDVQPLGIRGITMVYMEHEKTGAKLVYGACDDLERGFSVAFRTPAINDTGMPHVFEHSCLSGSEKYPDPSLFFSMINQTYVTFLNALTYPTVTVYPVASLSEEQLAANIDYNLNGVFKPLVLTDERAMMREAYRYELTDKDADITLNGTVYSEMKGAYTLAHASQYNTMKMLYPGSYTVNASGGDPDVIPQMTQQDLIDFHSRNYHPSNALFTLHGKIDLKRFLKQIDEFISQYDRREICIEDTNYAPATGYREQISKFPVTADSAAMTAAYYAFALPDATVEEAQLLSVACTLLTMDGNPIGDLAKERMPGVAVSVSLESFCPSQTILFSSQTLTEEQIPVFKSVIEDGIAMALKDGLNRDRLKALCKTMDYNSFDVTQTTQFGQGFVNNVPSLWGNSGDLYEYARIQNVALNLSSLVENGLVDEAFVKYLSAPENCVLSATVPERGALETKNAELDKSLKDMKAAMSDEEIEALVAKTADFAAWTDENAKNSMIDQMKAVSVHELPEELKSYTAEDATVDGMRTVTSTINSDEILDIKLVFDASTVPADELFRYSLATLLLKAMPTKNYTVEQLTDAVIDCMYTPSIMATTLSYNNDESYKPIMSASWRTTRSDLQKSFEIIKEVLFNTDWSDIAELRNNINQSTALDKIMVEAMPEQLGNIIAEAYMTDGGSYAYHIGGFDFMRYCTSLLQMTDEELLVETAKIQDTLSYVLNKNGFVFTCVGTDEGISEAKALGVELYGSLDNAEHELVNYTESFPQLEKPMALTINGDMQYNYMALNLRDCGIEKNNKLSVVSNVVESKLLFPNLRFVGGAYGAECGYRYPFIIVSSYRDPNLASTYDYYHKLGEELRALELTQDDIDGFITPFFSKIATSFSEVNGAKCAVSDVLTGKDTFAECQQLMHEIKQVTPEDIKELASVFDLFAEQGRMLTIGGAAAIEENRDMFEEINTYYVE